jgi:hypothetical protein
MYILLYKCVYNYNYTLFLCLWVEEEAIKSQREVHQQNIMSNNSSTISPTSDKEMRDACNTSNDSNSSDE